VAIAVSIFLSAFFLGCVFLYIKSESKEKWRKYLLFLIGIPFVVFVSIFLYLIIDEQREKRSYKTEPQKDTSKFPTHMKGIKLGDTLSNLQFEHGKFTAVKVSPAPGTEKKWDEALKHYIATNNVWIIDKDGIAIQLVFYCPSNPFDDTTYFHLIRCGDSSKQVFQAYGKSEITIRCSDKDVERRSYDIPSRRVQLTMKKDAVEIITFYTSAPLPDKFTKDC